MNLMKAVKNLENQGYCSICLTRFEEGNHDSCRVFSGIDPTDTNSRLIRARLEGYNGDWVKLLTTALYTLLVPWDKEKDELTQWFNNIESLLLKVENEQVHPTNIVNALIACQEDLYSLRRIAKYDAYSLADGFHGWNPKKPTTPVDFFTRSLQQNKTKVRKQTVKSAKTIMETLCKELLGPGSKPEVIIDEVDGWHIMDETAREILFDQKEKKIISVRLVNGRPIISSTFTLNGDWLGWNIVDDNILDAPKLPKLYPPNVLQRDSILTRWNRLISRKNQVNLVKNIVTAHGREILGNPDSKKSDNAALRSNAEIVKPGTSRIFEQFIPILDLNKIVIPKFNKAPNKIPYAKYEKMGQYYLRQYTPFKEPRVKLQAKAIGWILENKNSLCTIVLPTGTGKSLIPLCAASNLLTQKSKNQKPALVVVVCPLIALLEDQVLIARKDTIIPEIKDPTKRAVSLLHHSRSDKERRKTLKAIENGECVLLFLTAEQLQRETTLRTLSKRKVGWLFIDEAHGILEFEGYRPAYARIWYPIQRLKQFSPEMGIVIQTATLPLTWEKTIWQRLLRIKKYPNPALFRSTAIRKNLHFENVTKFEKYESNERNSESVKQTIDNVKNGKRTILYTLWRENYFKEMWRTLKSELQDHSIGYYHGGGNRLRSKNKDNKTTKEKYIKLFSQGKIDVTLATMAFGLGINRRDVKSVVFNGIPSSINTLYQQAGRAARGIKDNKEYEYEGHIHIFSQEEEDLYHQRHLSSLQRLYATTTVRILECMKNSQNSREIANGLYLLDLTVASNSCRDPGPSRIDKINNLNSLRILSEVGAIEWIAILSDKIRIPIKAIKKVISKDPNAFIEEYECERIGMDLIQTDIYNLIKFALPGKTLSLSQSYQLIQDLAIATMESPIAWDIDKSKLALIAWTWKGDKDNLEKAISEWRAIDNLNYQQEEDHIKEFLSKTTHEERVGIISEYFGFCGIKCKGCEGCR